MVCQVLKNRMSEPGGKLYLNFDAAHSTFTPVDDQHIAPTQDNRFIEVKDSDIPFI